jgi:hypothetical protein
MSDFFQFPEPEPATQPQPRPVHPPWVQAPRGVIPGAVPLELVLARSERAAVAVTKLGAYPDGFDFEVLVLVSDGEDELDPNVIGHPYRPGRGRRDEQHEMLRFGIEFADGSRVTNIPGTTRGHFSGGDDPPPGPVMQQQGGGGGGGEWRQRFWVWPLPPPGPLVFACEWPAAQIEFARVEVDAQPILDAASRAQRIFERAEGGGQGSFSNTVTVHSTGHQLRQTAGED